MTYRARPKTITHPCNCGCGALVTGYVQTLYTPACKRRRMNAQRRITRAVMKSQRFAERMRGPVTDPPKRKVKLCKSCYGLAIERGIDCACLHPRAEAAE